MQERRRKRGSERRNPRTALVEKPPRSSCFGRRQEARHQPSLLLPPLNATVVRQQWPRLSAILSSLEQLDLMACSDREIQLAEQQRSNGFTYSKSKQGSNIRIITVYPLTAGHVPLTGDHVGLHVLYEDGLRLSSRPGHPSRPIRVAMTSCHLEEWRNICAFAIRREGLLPQHSENPEKKQRKPLFLEEAKEMVLFVLRKQPRVVGFGLYQALTWVSNYQWSGSMEKTSDMDVDHFLTNSATSMAEMKEK